MRNKVRGTSGLYTRHPALSALYKWSVQCVKGGGLYSFCSWRKHNFPHKDFNLRPEILNSEMLKLTQWCRANKLSITLKNSNVMVFRPPQQRQKLDISIQIDNVIKSVKETVFLSVILDEHLSWKPHIVSVSRKISTSIRYDL